MSKIGCHISIAGGIENAPQRASELGCEVFQLFSRSPRGGPAPKITAETAKKFKEEMKKWNQENCYIHTPYYINFASKNVAIAKASVKIVREELERGSLIGAKYIMTHLGSAKDLKREDALKKVQSAVKEIIKGYKGSTKLLLEISAGSGEVIGDTFEELEFLLKGSDSVGVCLDSAHMFAAGYDIKSKDGFKSVIKKIKDTVGLDRVMLIHTNDSEVDLGARKDRHEHIGDGKIGREGFVHLMSQFKKTDFILETEHDKVKEDIVTLKNIRKNI